MITRLQTAERELSELEEHAAKSARQRLAAPAQDKAPAKGPGPVVLDVRCTANPGGPCADSNRAAPGASLRLSGRNLSKTGAKIGATAGA